MRTATTKFTALVIASLIAPTVVLAQASKFKEPVTITQDEDELSVTAELTGLGNVDLLATLTATATVITECENPGGNIVEAQEDTATLTEIEPVDVLKNGRATVDVSLSAEDVGNPCPNPKWTATPISTEFSNVSFTLTQGNDTLFACGTGGAPACVIN